MRFTDPMLKSLTSEAQKTYFDSSLPNFGIRIGKRRKTWVILKGEDRKRITIGHYPKLSLKEARRAAILAMDGLDATSPLFCNVLEQFCASHLSQTRPTTAKGTERLLRHTFDSLFTIPIHEIKAHVVSTIFDDMHDRPTTANNAHTAIRTLFNWALSREIIDRNPLKYLKTPYSKNTRSRLLSDDELRSIWHESLNHAIFGQIVRSLILSGQRLNQITCFDHAWIRDDVIEFPSTIMKGKAAHIIPLTPALEQHLPNLPRQYKSQSTGMRAFRVALNLPHWTLHDFRRYFSSTHAKLGTPIHVTEQMLAHTTGTRSPIQRVYDRHSYMAEMRSALEQYEQHLFTVIQERTP